MDQDSAVFSVRPFREYRPRLQELNGFGEGSSAPLMAVVAGLWGWLYEFKLCDSISFLTFASSERNCWEFLKLSLVFLLYYNYYYYTAGNAPYVNRFEAMNRRCGWSSLVVTQPSISHHLLCVQCVRVHNAYVCVLLCQVFIIAAHLGNIVIFYQLSPLTSQVTVNSAMSHRPF